MFPGAKRRRTTAQSAVEVHAFNLTPFAEPRNLEAAVLEALGRFAGVQAPASLEELVAFRRTPEAAKAFNLRSRFGSYWTSSGFGLPHGIAAPQVVEALRAWLTHCRTGSSSALLSTGKFVLARSAGKFIVKPPGGAKLDVHTDQVSPEALRRYLEQARPTLQEAAAALGVQAVFGLRGPAATEIPTNVTPQRLWWMSACCSPDFAKLLDLRVAPSYYLSWGGKAAGQGGKDLFRGGRLHPAVWSVMEALETGAAHPLADAVRSHCAPELLEWLRADDRAGARLPAPAFVVAGRPGELLLMLQGVPHGAAAVKAGRLAGTAKFWIEGSEDRPVNVKLAEARFGEPPKHRTWSIPTAKKIAFQTAWSEATAACLHDVAEMKRGQSKAEL